MSRKTFIISSCLCFHICSTYLNVCAFDFVVQDFRIWSAFSSCLGFSSSSEVNFIYTAQNHKSQICLEGVYTLHTTRHPSVLETFASDKEKHLEKWKKRQ